MSPRVSRRAFLAAACAPAAAQSRGRVNTVAGPIDSGALGVTLMHEHVVTDLRAPAERAPGDYRREDAVEQALPHFVGLRVAGGRTLVEPTPIYIGRDVEALREVSQRSGVQIVASTGIYGAASQRFIPGYARSESAEQLAARYVREFADGMDGTTIKPGLIKTGVNPQTPLPPVERKLVRAAALAHLETGLTVAAHTGPAAPVLEELAIIEEAGMDPSRFIWVHAQNENDHAARIAVAKRGAWVELDGVGPDSAERHLEAAARLASAGCLGRTLISQDAGWYRPGPERGSKYRGYAYLLETFVPMLRRGGFSQDDVDQLLVRNPRQALTGGALTGDD